MTDIDAEYENQHIVKLWEESIKSFYKNQPSKILMLAKDLDNENAINLKEVTTMLENKDTLKILYSNSLIIAKRSNPTPKTEDLGLMFSGMVDISSDDQAIVRKLKRCCELIERFRDQFQDVEAKESVTILFPVKKNGFSITLSRLNINFSSNTVQLISYDSFCQPLEDIEQNEMISIVQEIFPPEDGAWKYEYINYTENCSPLQSDNFSFSIITAEIGIRIIEECIGKKALQVEHFQSFFKTYSAGCTELRRKHLSIIDNKDFTNRFEKYAAPQEEPVVKVPSKVFICYIFDLFQN